MIKKSQVLEKDENYYLEEDVKEIVHDVLQELQSREIHVSRIVQSRINS